MDLEVVYRAALLACLIDLTASAAGPVSFIYTETARYDRDANQSAQRFPAGARLHLVHKGQDRLLFPVFAASADACISFDGRNVLFSAKRRSGEPWQIWEASLAGDGLRQLTTGTSDAIAPFYLPGDKIVYSIRTPEGFQIETPTLRLTYGAGDHIISDVLRDGRILFEAPHPAVTAGARDLYTVYSDGSGVETVRCDHRNDRRGARQLSSGDYLFETRRRLALFTSPRAVEVAVTLPAGEFVGPVAESDAGEWLVAFRRTSREPFGLFRWKRDSAAPVKIAGATGMHAVQPVIVASRPVPKRHPSALGDREGTNLLCLNVYTSKQRFPTGSVSAVRVYTQSESGSPVLLGRAPVERDGSFFVQTPSERPIRFELLGPNGNVIAFEKGWFWTRSGEQRICVGCHAGPERAPDNAVPEVLLRDPNPVKMLHPERPQAGVK